MYIGRPTAANMSFGKGNPRLAAFSLLRHSSNAKPLLIAAAHSRYTYHIRAKQTVPHKEAIGVTAPPAQGKYGRWGSDALRVNRLILGNVLETWGAPDV